MRTLSILLLASLPLAAADSAVVRGPVLGYVLDAGSQKVRPVNGFPGAAHVGEPLALPFPVAAAAFSARWALLAAPSGEVFLLRDAPAPLAGVLSRPDLMVFNSDGSAAALYSSGERRAQILRGLPDNPQPGAPFDLAAPVAAMALTRDASHLVLAGRESLWLAGDAASRLLSDALTPAAIALLNQDRDLLVADAATDRLLLIRDFASTADLFHWAGPSDGVSAPVGLAASGDRVLVANAGARTLDVFHIPTRALETRLALDWTPTRLALLPGHPVFLLNDLGRDPLLLADTAGSPGVYFVPVPQEP